MHAYFPGLADALAPEATVIEVDPPGMDIATDRRWLRLPDHALALAEAVQLGGDDPVVVIGHSLGGLIAVQLAVQEPRLVAGLLLLDTAPLLPPPRSPSA